MDTKPQNAEGPMSPSWSEDGTRLLITGKLRVTSCEVEQNKVIVGAKVIAVDEAGVTWDISTRNFVFEKTFHLLPDPFPAQYLIQGNAYREPFWVPAASVKEAISKMKDRFNPTPGWYNKNIRRIDCSAPSHFKMFRE